MESRARSGLASVMRAAEARSASRRVGHFIAELWMLSTDVEKLRQNNRRRITGLE